MVKSDGQTRWQVNEAFQDLVASLVAISGDPILPVIESSPLVSWGAGGDPILPVLEGEQPRSSCEPGEGEQPEESIREVVAVGEGVANAGLTLNPTPYTLHSKPYTLHPTPYTRDPKPETRNPKPETRNPPPGLTLKRGPVKKPARALQKLVRV